MTDFLRRIISGPKARFKDPRLGTDLDLVYVTDNIVIMGYPASGLASLYRNKRSDVRKFLNHRHEDRYRIYNFCPRTENVYDPGYFYDRVSRFPFPDHHAPPLSMIPLFVADMTDWLESDPDSVAVIHCKAGKGRSGTMTCCYLISLPYLPSPPQDVRNYSHLRKPPSSQSRIQTQKDAAMALADDAQANAALRQQSNGRYWETTNRSNMNQTRESMMSYAGGEAYREAQILADKLRAVFELHTQQRMKPPKPKRQGGGRSRSKSAVGGDRPWGDGAIASHQSHANLRALGAHPAGRSCDALNVMNPDLSLGSTYTLNNYANSDFRASLSMSTSNLFGTGGWSEATNPEERQGFAEEGASRRVGVSIPSQRRFVGYWARILARKDPRFPITSVTPITSRRKVRITRITVERVHSNNSSSPSGIADKVIPHSDALSVQLARYDDSLVDRLESWERGARRRAKAFGANDPGAEALDEKEEEQKRVLKRLRMQQRSFSSWTGAKLDVNSREGSKELTKVGQWGVNVHAEAHRARAFDWRDEEPQIDYFSRIPESGRVMIDESGNERKGGGQAELWRYIFEPRSEKGNGKSTIEAYASATLMGADGGIHIPPRRYGSSRPHLEDMTNAEEAVEEGGEKMSSKASWNRSPRTPPSSNFRVSPHHHHEDEPAVGQLVDADREIMIKVLVGRTGNKHSKLPDITSAGWCWIVPSFEDPEGMRPKLGSKTVVRLESDEIDFRKPVVGLRAIEIEWEWVDVAGQEQEADEDHEEQERLDESL
ncbi:hypothetical protein IE53DRAFT_319705 [Violaceomyces palustris]|uniref:Uncharacterized protein n=1 Tax=Violaceomyces palustris TaxID=1673888 RepID=A0ACD0NR50_9BASI|nr:hypothetical protein IE53DRAFT_319705 [Violaceomyces palustris]